MNAVNDIYRKILSRKADELGVVDLAARFASGEEVISLQEMLDEMDAGVSQLIGDEFAKLDKERYELREGQLRQYDLVRKQLHESSGNEAIIAAMELGGAYSKLFAPDLLSQLSANSALVTETKRRIGKIEAEREKIPNWALMIVLCQAIWLLEEDRQLSTGQVAKEVVEIIKAATYDDRDLESLLPTAHKLLEDTVSKYSKEDLRAMLPASSESLRKSMKKWEKDGHLKIPAYAKKSGPRG